MTRVLALLDDRAGNNAQVLGVAEKLGLPFDTVKLEYNIWSKLPNRLLAISAAHITQDGKEELKELLSSLDEEDCLIVISAGRRQAPVARWLKSRKPRILLCHLMQPEISLGGFDVVGIPLHDHPPALSHIVPLLLSPHSTEEKKLSEARTKWEPTFAHLPHPRIGVLVGGTSKHATFEPADYRHIAQATAQAARQAGGSLLITTSRRTDREGVEAIASALNLDPHFLYRYGDAAENPYLGILACSDVLAVTADSIAMISEAAAAGRPLYILEPAKIAPKFARFTRSLYEKGIAKPFALPLDMDWKPAHAPDAATQIASKIKELFDK